MGSASGSEPFAWESCTETHNSLDPTLRVLGVQAGQICMHRPPCGVDTGIPQEAAGITHCRDRQKESETEAEEDPLVCPWRCHSLR